MPLNGEKHLKAFRKFPIWSFWLMFIYKIVCFLYVKLQVFWLFWFWLLLALHFYPVHVFLNMIRSHFENLSVCFLFSRPVWLKKLKLNQINGFCLKSIQVMKQNLSVVLIPCTSRYPRCLVLLHTYIVLFVCAPTPPPLGSKPPCSYSAPFLHCKSFL